MTLAFPDGLLLTAAAFLAGLVDAAAGGGGLIQIPALMETFPQSPLATLFGTNKLASIAGTASAAWRLGRRIPISWKLMVPAMMAAMCGAWLGAAIVSWLPRPILRPLVLVLLLAVALHTFLHKQFGHLPSRHAWHPGDQWRSALIGLVLGFYDGFFGPGTGSFLIFAFIRWLGMDFLQASASAKVINVATNLAAITFFTAHVPLLWGACLLMGIGNITGAQVGTFLALKKGSPFLRLAFLGVVVALMLKLAWELL